MEILIYFQPLNSINENNNNFQKRKIHYYTRHQSKKYAKNSLGKYVNNKYNLNNNSIEVNKTHYIRNNKKILFNELSNNLSNTIDNSIHTDNKMKKHYTPLKKNKIIKHILETNGDKNNSISKDKFESIKYNSTTNSQTKQNMKYKKIQLKNKIENLFPNLKVLNII